MIESWRGFAREERVGEGRAWVDICCRISMDLVSRLDGILCLCSMWEWARLAQVVWVSCSSSRLEMVHGNQGSSVNKRRASRNRARKEADQHTTLLKQLLKIWLRMIRTTLRYTCMALATSTVRAKKNKKLDVCGLPARQYHLVLQTLKTHHQNLLQDTTRRLGISKIY